VTKREEYEDRRAKIIKNFKGYAIWYPTYDERIFLDAKLLIEQYYWTDVHPLDRMLTVI
jgi:hypothetical protein